MYTYTIETHYSIMPVNMWSMFPFINIQNSIRQLKGRGIGVLISDHNVRETLCVCDKAYILDHGEILEFGEPDFIATSPRAKETYLGEKFRL